MTVLHDMQSQAYIALHLAVLNSAYVKHLKQGHKQANWHAVMHYLIIVILYV